MNGTSTSATDVGFFILGEKFWAAAKRPHIFPMKKMMTYFALAAGCLFVPALTFLAMSFAEGSIAEKLVEIINYALFYPVALVGLSIAFRGFRASHALYAIPIALLIQEVVIFAFSDLFGTLWPTANVDILTKTGLAVGAPILGWGFFVIGRATLYRFMAALLSSASVLAVVLFHILVATLPLEGIANSEEALVTAIVERDGNFETLCGLPGRDCFRGGVDQAIHWAQDRLRAPRATERLLDDTRNVRKLIYIWPENPTSLQLTKLSVMSVLKHDSGDVEVMEASDGPTMSYTPLAASLAIFIVVFHAIWIPMCLLILARHGNFRLTGMRWKKDLT